ncbi:MAG: long-chain fatty acid--CoA ligase [Rhodovibrionaceae bacterium]|nr:long-chain fatty acid--CoA ligase [Rhodovibrionaceae bacterium]
MKYEELKNLATAFFEQAEALPDQPFLWAKKDGEYQPLTWTEVRAAVSEISRGLRDIGLEPGQRVVLVAENRPEWLIADLAIVSAGGVTVPAYTTNTIDDHLHILTDSEAAGAIVSSNKLAQRLLPAAQRAPHCKWVVSVDTTLPNQNTALQLHDWHELRERGRGLPDDVAERAAALKREDTCCFIYTSGTGGTPKGVMLSHGNIICNCMGAYYLLKEIGLGHEVFLSFLPLSHSYEHTAGQYFPITIGAEIYYAEGVESLLNNLAEARPTIMTAVPRLYESMHQRIRRGVAKEGGRKKQLFDLAEKLGRKRYNDPTSLGLGERILDFFVDRLVRNKVRGRFGGRLKAMVSGGAALNPEIGIFFTALGLRILQGYGQTEAAPVISANPPRRVKMHTVGPPLKGVEVKIADDGEILVRGELVMKGYWRREDETRATLVDGWLHTGDIGDFDEDGYLRITDRKKDIIVLSGGDNISPARVEGFLTLQPEISQAMVYGDKRPHLVAIIVPDQEWVDAWAREHDKSREPSELSEDAEFRKAIDGIISRVNQRASNLEKVRRFTVAPEPFTVDNDMLTPTMKIRRHKIKEAFQDRLEALY